MFRFTAEKFKTVLKMKLVFFVVAIVASLLALSSADMYMQNPRGSNNRLNENSANRRTANRMFDSQVSRGIDALAHVYEVE